MAHSYYLGRSGSGKSTLLMHHAIEAIQANHGLCFIDPHGTCIDELLAHIPPARRQHTILFDPTGDPVPYNPLATDADPNQVADALLYAFRDIWKFGDISTPTFDEYILHSVLTLLQLPQPQLLMIGALLQSERFREDIVRDIEDPHLLSFWANFERLTSKEQRDEIRSTKNKMNSIISDLRLRRILGVHRTAFTMDQVLTDHILLVRLPQGKLGITKTRLLGMLLLSQLHLATYNRDPAKPFHLFIDEAHHFQGHSLMELLSGSRKFGITLHVSHQYLRQVDVLEDGGKERYQAYIDQLDEVPRRFFESQFDDNEFKRMRKAVLRRLYLILENSAFERMFRSPECKLDLFGEMQAGKLILINTSKATLKDQGTATFGRFFIALIAQAAAERAMVPQNQKTPTFVYIDEAHEYLDSNISEILAQARKQNIGLTLAHQNLGQIKNNEVKTTIEANTSVKLAGNVSSSDAKNMAGQMNTEPKLLQNQPTFTFLTYVRGLLNKALPVAYPPGGLDRWGERSDYDLFKADQWERYGASLTKKTPEKDTNPPPDDGDEEAADW